MKPNKKKKTTRRLAEQLYFLFFEHLKHAKSLRYEQNSGSFLFTAVGRKECRREVLNVFLRRISAKIETLVVVEQRFPTAGPQSHFHFGGSSFSLWGSSFSHYIVSASVIVTRQLKTFINISSCYVN